MKKLSAFVFAVILVFGINSVSNAQFFPITESYTGFQLFVEGNSFDFGIDLWFTNDVFGVGTNSSLSLTKDAWIPDFMRHIPLNGNLHMKFYSVDSPPEFAKVTLSAWDNFGNDLAVFDLGVTKFWAEEPYNQYYDLVYNFGLGGPVMSALGAYGWGNINIAAAGVPGGSPAWWWNDFALTEVSMTVDPIPEPSTILLLGTGLLGLGIFAGSRRKRKA